MDKKMISTLSVRKRTKRVYVQSTKNRDVLIYTVRVLV